MWQNEIKFYRTKEPYGFLSNFAPYPVEIDEKVWPTSEHYFQSQKFLDENLQEKIRLAPTPKEAARIGRDRSNPLRKDWEQSKINVMLKALYAKFSQHEDIKFELLKTNDARLIEHTTNDSIWGDGGDGSGSNLLGRLLEETRKILLDEFLRYNYRSIWMRYPELCVMVEFVDNVIRFKKNKAVCFVYDNRKTNDLWVEYHEGRIPLEDIEHLYMQIGYSLSGFGDIFYAEWYPDE